MSPDAEACRTPGDSSVTASPNVAAVAGSIDANGVSICADDIATVLLDLPSRPPPGGRDFLFPRPIPRDATGHVTCVVRDRSPDGSSTDLPQLAVLDGTIEPGDGWYYDDFSSRRDELGAEQMIVLTGGVAFRPGHILDVDCLDASDCAL
jgi:hypothetical protein